MLWNQRSGLHKLVELWRTAFERFGQRHESARSLWQLQVSMELTSADEVKGQPSERQPRKALMRQTTHLKHTKIENCGENGWGSTDDCSLRRAQPSAGIRTVCQTRNSLRWRFREEEPRRFPMHNLATHPLWGRATGENSFICLEICGYQDKTFTSEKIRRWNYSLLNEC